MESADSSFETMEWLKAWTASIGEHVRATKNVTIFISSEARINITGGRP